MYFGSNLRIFGIVSKIWWIDVICFWCFWLFLGIVFELLKIIVSLHINTETLQETQLIHLQWHQRHWIARKIVFFFEMERVMIILNHPFGIWHVIYNFLLTIEEKKIGKKSFDKNSKHLRLQDCGDNRSLWRQ